MSYLMCSVPHLRLNNWDSPGCFYSQCEVQYSPTFLSCLIWWNLFHWNIFHLSHAMWGQPDRAAGTTRFKIFPPLDSSADLHQRWRKSWTRKNPNPNFFVSFKIQYGAYIINHFLFTLFVTSVKKVHCRYANERMRSLFLHVEFVYGYLFMVSVTPGASWPLLIALVKYSCDMQRSSTLGHYVTIFLIAPQKVLNSFKCIFLE